MTSSVTSVLEIAKEHGPITAAWLVVFAVVAWIAGAGAKLALNSVRGLLKTSADLQEAMQRQLADERDRTEALAAQLADSSAQLTHVRVLLAEAVEGQRQARAALEATNARHDALRESYDALRTMHDELQARMRDTLLAQHITGAKP